MLRQRKKSQHYGVEIIKQLDSFPKVNKDDFIEKSRLGGIGMFYIIVFMINFLI